MYRSFEGINFEAFKWKLTDILTNGLATLTLHCVVLRFYSACAVYNFNEFEMSPALSSTSPVGPPSPTCLKTANDIAHGPSHSQSHCTWPSHTANHIAHGLLTQPIILHMASSQPISVIVNRWTDSLRLLCLDRSTRISSAHCIEAMLVPFAVVLVVEEGSTTFR